MQYTLMWSKNYWLLHNLHSQTLCPPRFKCPPTKMKDNSSKQLRSPGGRLNENPVAWQRTRDADEKLCRLIRKPGRLHDEKPETWPVMGNWWFTGSACVQRAVVTRQGHLERENDRDRVRGRGCLHRLGPHKQHRLITSLWRRIF